MVFFNHRSLGKYNSYKIGGKGISLLSYVKDFSCFLNNNKNETEAGGFPTQLLHQDVAAPQWMDGDL